MNSELNQQNDSSGSGELRIAYVISAISSDNTGMGGSYRSLMALASGMIAAGTLAKIFSLGDIYPVSYRSSVVPVEHIDFNRVSGYLQKVIRQISAFNPTHVHAFDNKSYFFARLVAKRLGIPAVITRPGGPNPRKYFPHARNVVAFSDENGDYFRSLKKLSKSNIHVIPNRISDFELCSTKEQRLRKQLGIDGSELVVLRICRIGSTYAESIRQAANLVRRLNDSDVPSRLVVIGLIQEHEAFEKLRQIDGIRADFVTDSEYTLNANELIGIGDVVVGVGRGFMEAALHGKILLAPVSGEALPALATPENVAHLERTNFSPRGSIPDFDAEQNFQSVLELLASPEIAQSNRDFIKSLAVQKFSVRTGVARHLGMYSADTTHTSSPLIDRLLNFAVVARFYLPVAIGIRKVKPQS